MSDPALPAPLSTIADFIVAVPSSSGSNQGGLNIAPVDGGERQLRSVYVRAFQKACMNSLSMMSAYSSYDGVPAVADHHVLVEILRDEWNYKYFVTCVLHLSLAREKERGDRGLS